jgi:hypothetical protein
LMIQIVVILALFPHNWIVFKVLVISANSCHSVIVSEPDLFSSYCPWWLSALGKSISKMPFSFQHMTETLLL